MDDAPCDAPCAVRHGRPPGWFLRRWLFWHLPLDPGEPPRCCRFNGEHRLLGNPPTDSGQRSCDDGACVSGHGCPAALLSPERSPNEGVTSSKVPPGGEGRTAPHTHTRVCMHTQAHTCACTCTHMRTRWFTPAAGGHLADSCGHFADTASRPGPFPPSRERPLIAASRALRPASSFVTGAPPPLTWGRHAFAF